MKKIIEGKILSFSNNQIEKMRDTLDFSSNIFKSLLNKSSEIILNKYNELDSQKGYHDISQKEIETWFDEEVPINGMPADEVLKIIKEKIYDTATGNLGPNMYAYVMSGGNQISVIADKLSSAINQNVTKWHLAPALTEIDKRVIQWASEITRFGDKVGGFIGSSGSSANLDGLTVARNIFFEKQNIRTNGLFELKPFRVYCSEETHSSIDKSVQLLGIGSKNLKKIKINEDFTINTNALKKQIRTDIYDGFIPFCIIGNAGTVNTGAIDNLEKLSEISKENKMWFHVDGCYGGLASSLESKRNLYKGINLADSLALDFHKWLYQPFEVGCLLVKNWRIMERSYFQKASYLDKSLENENGRLDLNEHHFLLSRNAKSLKVWMSLKVYGLKRLKEMIQKDIDLTEFLKNEIKKSKDFELVSDSPLAICCFRFNGGLKNEDKILKLNEKLIPALERDGRVFITGTKLKGKLVLRACLNNHRKNIESTKYLIKTIREVGLSILK